MKLNPHLAHLFSAVKSAFHSPCGSSCAQEAPAGKIQTISPDEMRASLSITRNAGEYKPAPTQLNVLQHVSQQLMSTFQALSSSCELIFQLYVVSVFVLAILKCDFYITVIWCEKRAHSDTTWWVTQESINKILFVWRNVTNYNLFTA